MTWRGGTILVSAVLVLAACGAEGGADDDAQPATTSTTAASSDADERSPTTTKADDPAAEAIPWSEVVAATEVRSGTLDKVTGAMWDDTDEFVEGGRLEESIGFDQDRSMVERTMEFDISDPDVPEGPLRFVYAGEKTYLSAPWVEERCGAAWVPMGEAVGEVLAEAGVADAFDTDILFPLDPLGAIAEATPELPPAEVTSTWTSYDVDVPAALIVAPNYLAKRPEVAEALLAQTLSAAVSIDSDGELEIEMRMPLSVLADAGDPDVGPVGDQASMWAMWNLRDPGEPVDITEPTDVAPDASCAD